MFSPPSNTKWKGFTTMSFYHHCFKSVLTKFSTIFKIQCPRQEQLEEEINYGNTYLFPLLLLQVSRDKVKPVTYIYSTHKVVAGSLLIFLK